MKIIQLNEAAFQVMSPTNFFIRGVALVSSKYYYCFSTEQYKLSFKK